ncbi:MAG TPA: hypothetical protein VIL96_03775 [Gaiellaceae bacterium]|jgi:hypothetical protein
MDQEKTNYGAYGLRLARLEGSRELLVQAPADWPSLEVDAKVGDAKASWTDCVSNDRAELVLLTGGGVRIDRDPLRAVYTVPRPLSDQELIHPYLAVAATIAGRWLGRESFHAGAVVIDGGAWALVGERGTGKSSTLGWLALHGYEVLCDDALIVAGGCVFAGPRAVDLRAEAARCLQAGEELGLVGGRERWRLTLGPVKPVVPLRGWFFLDWDDEISTNAVRPRDRLSELARHRAVRLPPLEPGMLLALSALPAWRLRRPRDWSSLESAATALLAAIGR